MQGMRDLLRSSLGVSLRDLSAEDRLAAAWPVACGSALASHGEIDRLEDGVVYVLVLSEEWMQPFFGMRLTLLNDLRRIASVPLSGIHFERKPKV
jgi:hypothetical protein